MSQPTRVQLAIAYLVVSIVLLAPLLVIRYLPLHDYHNHLARMHILAAGQNNPILNQYYMVEWQILPNLAMDAVVPLLARVLSVEDATRVFVALALLLMTSGTIALHRVLTGQWHWWPLVAALFVYNRVFLFGFVNYLAAVGLFLWALAAWIHWRERRAGFRIAVFSLASALLFFCHLYALGLYGICILGFELTQWRRWLRDGRSFVRESLPFGLQFVFPLYLLLFHSPTGEAAGVFEYDQILPFLRDKLRAVYQLTTNYHVTFDRLTFVVLLLGFLAGLAAGWLRVDRRMLWPIGLLVAVFLLMPHQLFGSNLADFRLPVALALVVVASLRPIQAPAMRFVLAALAGLFLVRMGLVIERWHAFDGVYEQYLEAIAPIPEGSRLVAAVAQRPEPFLSFAPTLMYVNTLAVIHKSAFEPTLFAEPGKQPVTIVPEWRPLAEAYPWDWPAAHLDALAPGLVDGRDGEAPRGMLFEYQYLLLLYPESAANPAPQALQQLYTAPLFHFYEILAGVEAPTAAARRPRAAGSGDLALRPPGQGALAAR
jgi:hypothetical protein